MMNLTLIMTMSMMLTMTSKNPMKCSIMILMSSMTMFMILQKSTGSIMMPFTFFMIFSGGIMMMLMILSSLYPNYKKEKIKMPLTTMILIYIAMIMKSSMKMQKLMININLMSIMYNLSFLMIMMLTLYYFLTFMNMITSEKMAMRYMTF